MRAIRATAMLCAGLLAAVQTSPTAVAQEYLVRAVTIVVPFTPGGTTDILARIPGQKLSERLGKNFLIENKPGAGR